MNDDEVQNEIPAWIGGTGQYAVIHVQYEPGGGEAWPVVQRVPGGWQSGAHHYPDDAVLDVRPLILLGLGEMAPLGASALNDPTPWATNRDMALEFERGRRSGYAAALRVRGERGMT